MEKLPVEIIEKILQNPNLEINDVINLSMTSSHFHNIIKGNNSIWKPKYLQYYPTIWKRLLDKPKCYQHEFHHIYVLRQHIRESLENLAQRCYRKLDLGNEDFKDWEDMIQGRADNYFYIAQYLMEIVSVANCFIDCDGEISFNTPGNLTRKYYASKVLRFVKQLHISKKWQEYLSLPVELRLLENGAILVAQWFQFDMDIDPDSMYMLFDEIADKVKSALSITHPHHPLLKATEQELHIFRTQATPRNAWGSRDCRPIIGALNEVFFRNLQYRATDPECESDVYINIAIWKGRGAPETLAAIYDAVARRLGLHFEPIFFPSHFLLRFCESREPGSDWYYIDVTNGGGIVKSGTCPFNGNVMGAGGRAAGMSRPADSPEDIVAKMVKLLERLARVSYSPNGHITTLRSVLELTRLVNPRDILTLVDLIRLYMQLNFRADQLESDLLACDMEIQEVRNLANVLRNYRPKPLESSIKPERRGKNDGVKFAVGMVMRHLLYKYKCVIFNWDTECMATAEWKWRNSVSSLQFKDKQPFYNVLAEDNSHRYVAQENLIPAMEPMGLELDDEVGRYFSHYYKTHYVPNAQNAYHYPDDKEVRMRFHNELYKKWLLL